MKIDNPIENLEFNLKEYDYKIPLDGSYRIEIYKKDLSEKYLLDILSFPKITDTLLIKWAMPRLIFKDGEESISQLDPEVWECCDESFSEEYYMFHNIVTNGRALLNLKSQKVSLLYKGDFSKCTPMELTKRVIKNLKIIPKKDTMLKTKILSSNEIKARETLRELISEKEWRRFLKKNYILVEGESGKIYQIFKNDSENIRVFEEKDFLYTLCIHSEGVPPTDHIINCMLLIKADEDEFTKICNKHEPSHPTDKDPDTWLGFGKSGLFLKYQNKNLNEIFKINKNFSQRIKIPHNWIDNTAPKHDKYRHLRENLHHLKRRVTVEQDDDRLDDYDRQIYDLQPWITLENESVLDLKDFAIDESPPKRQRVV